MATGRVPTTANSPLTAKGDLFGYSTTQARVAVGNDGETLVADSSTATGLKWAAPSTGAESLGFTAGKNRIINGDFNVNQRSFTSLTLGGTDQYGFDRWTAVSNTGTVTYSAQTFTPGTAPVTGYESTNFARVLTTSQSASAAYSLFQQKIESVRTFANQTITVSFWAKAASATPKIALEIQQGFGSGGSAIVNTYAGQATLSTSWARYSITVAVPSISGKTIGTSSLLAINLWVSAGTDFNGRTGSLGVQNNTIDIWGVQAEAGSTMTAFQTATGTLQGELAACQRYYFRTIAGSAYGTVASYAHAANSTTPTFSISAPVTMRTAPSSMDYSGLAFVNYADTVYSISALSLNINLNGQNIVGAGSITGATAGHAGRLTGNNNSAAYLGFSAEL